MNRWKSIAGILAIFLLGMTIGVTGTGLIVRYRVETLHRQDLPPVKSLVMHRMIRHLDLTEKQQLAVETILNDFQQQLAVLRQTYKPEARRLSAACFERIGRELDPNQKKEFDRIRQRLPWQLSRHRGPGRHHIKESCPKQLLDQTRLQPSADEQGESNNQ